MNDLFTTATLAGIDEEAIPIVAMAIGGGIAIIAIIFGNIRRIAISENREKSRREVAAYVAEGSITPQDAERILVAGKEFETKKST